MFCCKSRRVFLFLAYFHLTDSCVRSIRQKRLAGASLLIFANKQDITGSMSDAEIKVVSVFVMIVSSTTNVLSYCLIFL